MRLQERHMIERSDLKDLSEVKAQRPPAVGYCADSMFCEYEGTGCFQWWANTRGGCWSPYGEVLTNLQPDTGAIVGAAAQIMAAATPTW